jgi:hypothetical protein
MPKSYVLQEISSYSLIMYICVGKLSITCAYYENWYNVKAVPPRICNWKIIPLHLLAAALRDYYAALSYTGTAARIPKFQTAICVERCFLQVTQVRMQFVVHP